MRETCARVLAAALMTGAIAFAVGMPALFGTAHDLGRSVLAPPSSLQRTVRAPAFSAPSRRAAGRERPANTSPQTPGAGLAEQERFRSRPLPQPGKRAPTPEPKPAPQPEPTPAVQVGTRELASTSAAPTRAAEPGATSRAPQQLHPSKPKGRGKAKGHDQGNGNRPTPPGETAQPTSTTTCPPAPATPAATPAEPQAEPATDHGNEQGQGNGNGGGEGKGHDDGGHPNGNGQAKGHAG